MHQGARAHERDARDRLALLAHQSVHWRRLDRFHVWALRRVFQKPESSVLGDCVDRLVVLRDHRDALSGDLDAARPARAEAGAALSIYDVARSVGASAHIRPRRGRGVSPHPPVVPPQTSD